MASSILSNIEASISQLSSNWNIYTTVLLCLVFSILLYPYLTSVQPDIHPYFLARQSIASTVRQPGESAIYRSLDCPHGFALRGGLNVKDPQAPKWSSGREGDLRDIWRQAVTKASSGDSNSKMISVRGRGEPYVQSIEELTKDINIIGRHVQAQERKRVAIYLHNSVELLVTLFAAAFYNFTPILIPQEQSISQLTVILQTTKADALVAAAGTLPQGTLDALDLHIIWVVEQTSRQMNFLEDPAGTPGSASWHDIIERGATDEAVPPQPNPLDTPPNIVSIWQTKGKKSFEIMTYTQKNMVAAVAAQLAFLPRHHAHEAKDAIVSLESLALSYPLSLVLAILWSGGSVILTSSSGAGVDYGLAFQNVSPTIVVASPETLSQLMSHKSSTTNLWSSIRTSRVASALAAGAMSTTTTLLNERSPRLIYTSEKLGSDSLPLTAAELNDIRIRTGARVIYALTAAGVAGAVAQTHIFDYRASDSSSTSSSRSHFGAPLSSVEIKLVDTPHMKVSDDEDPLGHIVVSGPAAVGGEMNLQVVGRIREDHTLALF